ncbi:MAG: T9SS type A sorting domain-containing protein [Bacteroidetes bacterium]|nr:T9SS type A sorting domain-containing protein [Bacteroidota bacterium]
MKDANNGIMYGDPVGGRWTIFKTTNAGSTWDSTGCYLPQAASEAGWNNDMCIIGNNVWFGTNNSRAYYSSNYGANWTAQTTGEAGASGSDVFFNNATTGLYGGAALKLSTNGGTTWAANAGTGTGNYSGITGDGNSSFWTVRFSAAIGYSSNNGTTWSTAYTTTAGTVNDITRSRTGLLIYGCKSNGQIVKYGVTTGVTPVNNELVSDYSLKQNYPNPFNPSTNISFAIPQNGFVSLKVYNMLGKEVATLVNGNLNSGTYNYNFNASNLASGMYFYKLEAGNFTETKKMILVK